MVKVNLIPKNGSNWNTESIRDLLSACNVLKLCKKVFLRKLRVIRLVKISPNFIVLFWKTHKIGPIQFLISSLSSLQIRLFVILFTSSSTFSSFKRFFFSLHNFVLKYVSPCFSSFTLVLYGPQFHSGRSDHANKNLMKIKNFRSSSLCIFLIPRFVSPLGPNILHNYFLRYFPIYDQTKMNNYTVSHKTSGATRSGNWLRQYATSWKVAGSIRDGVIWIFNWFYPFGRIMALGPAQHIREMSK